MANYREAKEAIDNILSKFKDTNFMQYLYDWEYDPALMEQGIDEWDFREKNSLSNFLWTSELPEGIGWSHGSSKVVIWDEDDCEYVLKVAMSDNDDYYCKKEVEVYDAACASGCEDAFAWAAEIYPTGIFGNRGIYAMEFVDCNEEVISDESYSYQLDVYCEDAGLDSSDPDAQEQFSNYYCDCCDDIDCLWDWIVKEWSWEFRELVENIIRKFRINDIHTANVGLKGYRPILVDYSGY